MASNKYTVYQGRFVCHTCGTNVSTLRSYVDKKLLTWMCKDRHLSQVSLQTKKTRSDFE